MTLLLVLLAGLMSLSFASNVTLNISVESTSSPASFFQAQVDLHVLDDLANTTSQLLAETDLHASSSSSQSRLSQGLNRLEQEGAAGSLLSSAQATIERVHSLEAKSKVQEEKIADAQTKLLFFQRKLYQENKRSPLLRGNTTYDGDIAITGTVDEHFSELLKGIRNINGALNIATFLGTELTSLANLVNVFDTISMIKCDSLVRFEMANLKAVGSLSIGRNSMLQEISLPKLEVVWAILSFSYNPLLLTISAPLLSQSALVYIDEHDSLSNLIFSSLKTVSGNLFIRTNIALLELEFPELVKIGSDFTVSRSENMILLSFPKLEVVTGKFEVRAQFILTNISFPALRSVNIFLLDSLRKLNSTSGFPKLASAKEEVSLRKMDALQYMDELCPAINNGVRLLEVCGAPAMNIPPACITDALREASPCELCFGGVTDCACQRAGPCDKYPS